MTAGFKKVWIRLTDPTSPEVSITDLAKDSSAVWRACFASALSRTPFLTFAASPSEAAADAFADGNQAGLGGWYSPNGSPDPQEFYWFQLRLTPEMIPTAWEANPNPQRNIAFYELIAQVALIYIRSTLTSCRTWSLSIRQWCDNLGDVSAGNKLFSTKPPLRHALQLLSSYIMKHRISIELQHIAGSRNTIADGISRFASPEELGLDPSKRIQVSWQALCEPLRQIVAQSKV